MPNRNATDIIETTLRTAFYVIRIGDELLVKRTQLLPNHRLLVLSANDAYASFELDFVSNQDFAVIGRVKAFFRKI